MNYLEKETIVSLDVNFSNGSGGHSASIKTVLKAKDLSDDESELGTLIGSRGRSTTFSNEKIQTLMSNFIEVESTRSKDANGISISRKYQDITSLKLKSHCFVVRGRDSHPKDLGFGNFKGNLGPIYDRSTTNSNGLNFTNGSSQNSFGGSIDPNKIQRIPYFGETSNSPLVGERSADLRFPYKEPKRMGSAIFIGQIYNEESSVTSAGEKTALVYQSKELKKDLSFNLDQISDYYEQNPDWANYNLKYGYTLDEAVKGFTAAGIRVIGLPKDKSVLFEESGNLDSILSNIASKYGFYWFVDPFETGVVRFISSNSASNLPVFNPLEQSQALQSSYSSASYSENFIRPKIFNAFNSNIEKNTQTFEFGTGQRMTRFHPLDIVPYLKVLKIPENLVKFFYGLYISGKWNEETFDVYSIIATHLANKSLQPANQKLQWGDWWDDADNVSDKLESIQEAYGEGTMAQKRIDAYKGPLKPIDTCKFIRLHQTIGEGANETANGPIIVRPSGSQKSTFGVLTAIFELITNSIYVSNRFIKWKARRMVWGGSPMNISGPYKVDDPRSTEIKEIEALRNLHTLVNAAGKDDLTARFVFDNSPSTGDGDYGFIGVVSQNSKNHGGAKPQSYDYDVFNRKNYEFITVRGLQYLALKGFDNSYEGGGKKQKGIYQETGELLQSSSQIWKHVTNERKLATTLKAYYTRGKTVTDEKEGDLSIREEEEESSTQAGLNAIQQKTDEINERFDLRYYSVQPNGADGSPLHPVQLSVKNGSLSDIQKLEASNFDSMYSNNVHTATSSRTIVGLSLPNSYRVTLSALSIKFDGSGVSTTINESTLKLLKPAEQLIVDNNLQIHSSMNNSASNVKFSATQMNTLKI